MDKPPSAPAYIPPAHSMAREAVGRLNNEFATSLPYSLGRPPELMAGGNRRYKPIPFWTAKDGATLAMEWERYKISLRFFLVDYWDRSSPGGRPLVVVQNTICDACPERHAKLFKVTAVEFWMAGQKVANCKGIPSDRILLQFTDAFKAFSHEVNYLANHLGADKAVPVSNAPTAEAAAPQPASAPAEGESITGFLHRVLGKPIREKNNAAQTVLIRFKNAMEAKLSNTKPLRKGIPSSKGQPQIIGMWCTTDLQNAFEQIGQETTLLADWKRAVKPVDNR